MWEWAETSYELNNNSVLSNRVFRGGYSYSNSFGLSSSTRAGLYPAFGGNNIGFRVASLSSSASVPEPGTFGVLSLVGLALVAYRKRMKK